MARSVKVIAGVVLAGAVWVGWWLIPTTPGVVGFLQQTKASHSHVRARETTYRLTDEQEQELLAAIQADASKPDLRMRTMVDGTMLLTYLEKYAVRIGRNTYPDDQGRTCFVTLTDLRVRFFDRLPLWARSRLGLS